MSINIFDELANNSALLNEIEQKGEQPINRDNSFYVKTVDKYHRSYVRYDGIGKMDFIYSVVESADGLEGLGEIEIPKEDCERISQLYGVLRAHAQTNGSKTPSGTWPDQLVTIGSEIPYHEYYMENDKDAFDVASSIENIIIEKRPDIKELFDKSVTLVDQMEQQNRL